MSKMEKRKILNILFWIFLIIGIIMLVWRLFGQSPSDLAIIGPFVFMLLFKMWSISDELKEFKHDFRYFKHEVKSSFAKVKEDMDSFK